MRIEPRESSKQDVFILSNCHAILSDESSFFLPVEALLSEFLIPSQKNNCQWIRSGRADGYHEKYSCSTAGMVERNVLFDFSKATETLCEHAVGHGEEFGMCSWKMCALLMFPLLVVLRSFIAWKNSQQALDDNAPAISTSGILKEVILRERNHEKRRRDNIESEEINQSPLCKKNRTINIDASSLTNSEIPIRDVSITTVSSTSVV